MNKICHVIHVANHKSFWITFFSAKFNGHAENYSCTQITQTIGGGNFGLVFKGEWNGASVALKKLKSQEEFEEFQRSKDVEGTFTSQYCSGTKMSCGNR